MQDSVDDRAPIRATWKIGEVLARYPDLLEVLVGLSPAFSRLRNPILRKVQGRLVTVESAARIAGLAPGEVVRSLNLAAGLIDVGAATDEPAAATAAIPDWVVRLTIAREVDARPYVSRGEDPFAAITAAAAEVQPGEALRLRNSFEPVPLYAVLAKRGFDHWARRDAADEWEILFYRQPVADGERGRASVDQVTAPVGSASEAAAELSSGTEAVVTIDVSELVPPEPMVRILEGVAGLAPGGSLLVRHVRRPVHLYPRLEEMGLSHVTSEPGPGRVEILITRPAGSVDSSE